MADVNISPGNSSVELERTTKGVYTWCIKLYYVGSDLRSLREAIKRVLAGKRQIEEALGQDIIPSDEMQEEMERMKAELKKGQKGGKSG